MYSLVSISHGSRVLSYMGYSLDVKCFPNALVLKGLVLREAFWEVIKALRGGA
jgi:hypothetical protein